MLLKEELTHETRKATKATFQSQASAKVEILT